VKLKKTCSDHYPAVNVYAQLVRVNKRLLHPGDILKDVIFQDDDFIVASTRLENMFLLYDRVGYELAQSQIWNGRYYLGVWACKGSPYKVCIYDELVDKLHDHCLICGKPEERK